MVELVCVWIWRNSIVCLFVCVYNYIIFVFFLKKRLTFYYQFSLYVFWMIKNFQKKKNSKFNYLIKGFWFWFKGLLFSFLFVCLLAWTKWMNRNEFWPSFGSSSLFKGNCSTIVVVAVMILVEIITMIIMMCLMSCTTCLCCWILFLLMFLKKKKKKETKN